MTPEQFQRAEDLFDRSLELTTAERELFLRTQCADDSVVRHRVEAMLTEHVARTSFLNEPILGGSFHLASAAGIDSDRLAQEVAAGGRYRNLSKIAEGGFGVVYRAEQVEPVRRPVAVKVLKLGFDTRQILNRFEGERQTLALMDHPNIATVLDAGATAGGRPFFVMELVSGVPITDYCDREQLSVRGRIELFSQLCRAIQHAHQKGVIHRDLKPSNVLVGPGDGGAPFAKVIDFGIARAVQRDPAGATQLTQEGAWLGTPQYMSPEQAAGERDIDTRTDVYSLGVLLYQLLAGVTPFDEKALRAAARSALSPPRPSLRVSRADRTTEAIAAQRNSDSRRLERSLRGDLDWIVLKCLEHDRSRRYPTAESLDADLHRFLRHEPILARPPSRSYQLLKFVRRNRSAVAAAAVAALALVVGLILSVVGFAQADRQRAIADARNEELRFQLYVSQIERVQRIIETDGSEPVKAILGQSDPSLRGWEWRRLRLFADRSEATLAAHIGPIHSIDVSADGGRFVTAGADGMIRVWNAGEGRVLHELPGASPVAPMSAARFSPDGTLIACVNDRGMITIFDAHTAQPLRSIAASDTPLECLAFSPGNRHVAVGSRYIQTSIYAASTGERVLTLDPRAVSASSLTYSRDGSRILVGSLNNTVVVCSASDGAVLLEERGSDFVVVDAKFSPDGSRMASLGMDGQIWMRDAFDGSLAYKVAAGRQGARTLEFSPDGSQLAVAGADGVISLFDAATGDRQKSLRGHERPIHDLAFEPGGTRLISGDADGALKRWDLASRVGDVGYQHSNGLRCAAFAADDSVVFFGGFDLGVGLFDLRTVTIETHNVLSYVGAISARLDGRCVAVSGSLPSGDCVAMVLDEGLRIRHTWPAARESPVGISPDGNRILLASPDNALVVCDTNSGESIRRLPAGDDAVRCAVFAPDSRTIVMGRAGGRVCVWNSDAECVREAQAGHEKGAVTHVLFGAAWRVLITAGDDGAVRFWSWPACELRAVLATGPVTALAATPDAEQIASAGNDNMIRIWNVARAQQTMTVGRHNGRVRSLNFSQDGSLLASTGDDHLISIRRSLVAGPTNSTSPAAGDDR